jgi:FkbM family methyltransferase
VKSPLGTLALTVYSYYDVQTVNEIFCRDDYYASREEVFVDFGANIGIAAAYFLSRNPRSIAYLFEPVPFNLERLRANLAPFEGRYMLEDAAVCDHTGTVQFNWEHTGRYGGIGVPHGNRTEVRSVDSNEALERIATRHGAIDVLKIDVEGLEPALIQRLPPDLAMRIRQIYAECRFDTPPLQTHTYVQRGSIARLTLARA